MSGEIELTAGYTFAEGETITIAKLRAAVEGIVARIAAGAITETELADGEIGLDKLSAEVFSSVVVPDDAVTSDKLASGAVTTSKIADDAVDRDKIAANVAGTAMTQNVDGSLSPVPDDATLYIYDGKLAVKPNGIGAGQIANFAVDTNHLNLAAITTAKIDAGAITEPKISTSAVTLAALEASALGQVNVDESSMSLACTASTDNAWKSWTVTPRTSGGSFLVLVLAEVTYGGTAPAVTFKLFDGVTEEASLAVQAVSSGAQLVAALFHSPGDTSSHTLAVKVNPDQTCSMGSNSKIVWLELPSK